MKTESVEKNQSQVRTEKNGRLFYFIGAGVYQRDYGGVSGV